MADARALWLVFATAWGRSCSETQSHRLLAAARLVDILVREEHALIKPSADSAYTGPDFRCGEEREMAPSSRFASRGLSIGLFLVIPGLVLAAFPPESGPRLKALSFGYEFRAHTVRSRDERY